MPCHLEYTDATFVFKGRSYPDVPLLIDSEYLFVEAVCDYLRYLVTHAHLKVSSVRTYADALLQFWNYLESMRLSFENIRDTDLIRWLNRQEKRGVGELTQTGRCDVVFDFYVWLEMQGYVRQMVRIPGYNDTISFKPNLTANSVKTTRYMPRASKYGIVSAVRPRRAEARQQITPTEIDITNIYIAADGPDNLPLTERNHLLIDWYNQDGLRRMECALLTKSQIPNWDVIDGLRERGESLELRLFVTKGGNPRYVGVLPELLENTREYIEGARAELVKRFKLKHGGTYREPEEIFLSNKTGRALCLTSISNLFTKWFSFAGVKSHGHRLRAAYLTCLFEAEIAAEETRIATHPGTKMAIDYELILRKVAERAGHRNIDSLRRYVTLAKKRRARASGNDDFVTLTMQIRALNQKAALLRHQILQDRETLDAKSTRKGKNNISKSG